MSRHRKALEHLEITMDILKYKDYEGTAELDMSRGVCRGKILFINDLVTYEAASPADLQREFEAAVDDYLDRERSYIDEYMDAAGDHVPYRQAND